jgi:hypothetical protein
VGGFPDFSIGAGSNLLVEYVVVFDRLVPYFDHAA